MAKEDDRAAKAQADATKAEQDQVVNGRKTQSNNDATGAQTRDKSVADVHYSSVIADAQKVDTAVKAGAADADRRVSQEVANAAVALVQDVAAKIADIQTKLQLSANQSVDDHDAAMARLIDQVATSAAKALQAANDWLARDNWLPLNSPVFSVYVPSVASDYQVFYDYIPNTPSWQTAAITTAAIGAGILIPGAGTAIAIIALGSLTGGSVSRYYDGGHTVAGAILGSGADMTGITAVYGSITNRDIASGNHLDLTDAQRRGMLTEGGIQTVVTAAKVGLARWQPSIGCVEKMFG